VVVDMPTPAPRCGAGGRAHPQEDQKHKAPPARCARARDAAHVRPMEVRTTIQLLRLVKALSKKTLDTLVIHHRRIRLRATTLERTSAKTSSRWGTRRWGRQASGRLQGFQLAHPGKRRHKERGVGGARRWQRLVNTLKSDNEFVTAEGGDQFVARRRSSPTVKTWGSWGGSGSRPHHITGLHLAYDDTSRAFSAKFFEPHRPCRRWGRGRVFRHAPIICEPSPGPHRSMRPKVAEKRCAS